MTGLKRGRVELAAHQSGWSEEAEKTIQELKYLLGDIAADIQHIGSTAIAFIHAKPILDIAVGVYELHAVMPCIAVLSEKGYLFRGEDVPGQILFVKGDLAQDIRTHHIHIVEWNGEAWRNYLNFRDHLNAFPEKAMLYDRCKQELALRFPQDRKQYTAGKQALVAELLAQARAWRSAQ